MLGRARQFDGSRTGSNGTQYFNSSFTQRGGWDFVINGSNTDQDQGDMVRRAGSQRFQDYAGAEQMRITSITNAVNYWNFQGAITGSGPTAAVQGTDTNIQANWYSKGTGSHIFGNGSGVQFGIVDNGAATANYFTVKGGASGVDPTLTSQRGGIIAIADSQQLTFSINGFTALKVGTAAAVSASDRWFEFNASSSTGARMVTQGSASAVTGYLQAKGAGSWVFANGAGTHFTVDGNSVTSGIVNQTVLRASQTGSPVQIRAQGSDTDVAIQLVPQATADVLIGGSTSALTTISYPTTTTAPGTTGNRTINKATGRVNIAAAGTTVTVTNSLVTSTSNIIAWVMTNDTTAYVKNVVPGSGSFVINIAAATAEVAIGFLVLHGY